MKKRVDCFIVGHNEMNFSEYEKTIKKMGTRSGAYRDLGKNFLVYNHKPYHLSDVFNLFCYDIHPQGKLFNPMNMLETFSATIAYLGTFLHRRGLSFDFVNSFQDEKEELAAKLKEENILTIAITTTLYVSVLPILEIMDFIRTYNQSAKIIIGGPFISTKARTQDDEEFNYLLKSIGADFYVNSSQGETTLVNIIHSLKNNAPAERIENIYYKTKEGYSSTPPLRETNQISENTVDWSLFAQRLGEYAALRTSISCPFSCAFCGFPEHAGEYQTMAVAGVEKELDQLDEIGVVKYIHFIDDTFNIPVKRFKQILRMMRKNKYKFKWHSYFRCQFADEEMVELMKESGCEGVFLGLESGSNHILTNMNKMVDVEKYLKGIAQLKEYDMVTFGNFIIGFPGETEQTIKDTKDFIKDSKLDFYRAQLWYCEPITPIWRERKKFHIKGESFEWSHATMDAKTACDLIDELFLSIEIPTWIPQYNFDFDNLCHLFHRGMGLQQVKEFLHAFNQGVKEKLLNPSQKEISFDVIRKLKEAYQGSRCLPGTKDTEPPKINIADKYGVAFDF
jgi:anaerobic magnesium-protoporphyrin IX monomethyl ester cyclase